MSAILDAILYLNAYTYNYVVSLLGYVLWLGIFLNIFILSFNEIETAFSYVFMIFNHKCKSYIHTD